ncbi:8-amino-7-oxononanoate synthase [Chlorella vulgaris]
MTSEQQRGEPDDWQQWLASSVAGLHSRSLFRMLRPTVPGLSAVEASMSQADIDAWVEGRQPASTTLPSLADCTDLRTIKLFSLNDYLGLSTHPAVRQAAANAALLCGNGPRSSALVGGYTHWHAQLERALARLKGTQDCLLFPTGFAANLAVAAALCHDGNVTVLSDELNHASIVDGVALARRRGAQLLVYRHNDLAHLEQLLKEDVPPGSRTLVITDSLFSMDGDFADLRGLAALKRRHNFLLVVDEAHATLVCGPNGGGAAEMLGVTADVDLHVGTLSKACGCLGGFVACSSAWKDLLVNRGRAQVYSTALPVPVVAAALAAIRVAEEEPWRRQHVWRLARRLGRELGVPVSSPIVPLLVGTEQAAMDASMQLLRCGFHVPAIRPPTVPAGTSRLRVSLSAAHTDDDLRRLTSALRGCGLRFQPWKQAQGEAGSRGVQPADVEPGEVEPRGPSVGLMSRL